MSYTPVPLVTTGDLWTASNNNTYVRDNFNQTDPHVMTTTGDMVYASSSANLARLAFAANSLMVNNGIPLWFGIGLGYSHFRTNMEANGFNFGFGYLGEYVTRPSSSQSVAPSTNTAISFQYKNIDAFSMWDAGNPTRVYIPADFPASRWYRISGYFHWEGPSEQKDGILQMRFYKNSTTYFGGSTIAGGSLTPVFHQNAMGMVKLEPGDYLQLVAYHTDSSTLELYQARFSVMVEI